ncbi:MAG: methyltransferase, partial [bacterium]|nr:methyltransferase [bacterium]
FFKPITIGRRLLIIPPWEQSSDTPGRIKIIIEPGMAFGTGNHDSTEMALALLDKHIRSGQKVWDIGTGTGILAIAAAKLGSGPVYSNDDDPLSVDSALLNFEINGVSDSIEVELISVDDVPIIKYDLITANLFRKMLIDNSRKIYDSLNPDGMAILSGIEAHEKDDVMDAYIKTGFEFLDSIEKKDWCSLAFMRKY